MGKYLKVMENFNKILHNLYYDIQNSSIAYTSKNNLYKQAKLLNKNITRKLVDKWWQSQKILLCLSL